jgi:hypothetical protein
VLTSRLQAQLLGSVRAERVDEVVHRILAVQAQDARAFRLAVRARSRGLTAAAVDRALSEDRSVIVSWLCRGTLHLVAADDYWWLHTLTAPRQLGANRRRLAELGVDERQQAAAVSTILESVSTGPKSRAELGVVLEEAGVPTAGQALVHLLAAASFHAHLVRGPVREGQHCFVDADRWLTRPAAPGDRDATLARLARRYLAGHGPASARDLAAFSGITLGDARKGLDLISAETAAAGDLRRLVGPEISPEVPPPRLLGMFDPVLHGWADRSFLLGDYPGVVTTNGIFKATALVQGRVVGTWTLPEGVVTVDTNSHLGRAEASALEDEAADVLRFLGLKASPLRVVRRTPTWTA